MEDKDLKLFGILTMYRHEKRSSTIDEEVELTRKVIDDVYNVCRSHTDKLFQEALRGVKEREFCTDECVSGSGLACFYCALYNVSSVAYKTLYPERH